MAGKFCLRRCVGTGASGTVYQADQLALGRTVAIKILRPELTRDPRFVGRFHDEALAASRLNHPNTVSIIDYGQTEDGLLYLVMEFLRGPTLTQVLHSESLRPSRIADLVAQILSGLEEAHQAGVVHADLKADNIVVERRRGDGTWSRSSTSASPASSGARPAPPRRRSAARPSTWRPRSSRARTRRTPAISTRSA